MLKIEADTLETAYAKASDQLGCSVTELEVQVIQVPSKGFLNLFFKKQAIIVARSNVRSAKTDEPEQKRDEEKAERKSAPLKELLEDEAEREEPAVSTPKQLNETILPQSFVTDQDEDNEAEVIEREDYSDKSAAVSESFFSERKPLEEIAEEVGSKVNELFASVCFDIDAINVSPYDDETLLIEFSGADAALLIGKEGYRYKALSYMLFNWINAEYQLQLRLEIAEFLKNQEESIGRYLVGVYENIERDGRSQTKILDGVLVQIALRELRSRYPDKYVAIRSTRDGAKFIIINDYNEY
ncbi:MAG: Jag N-terminal domain-containing protein [Campylobacterota bacterium]|nr:Jag N-terminal domain-containing protein [Campylobacterota bacterium]